MNKAIIISLAMIISVAIMTVGSCMSTKAYQEESTKRDKIKNDGWLDRQKESYKNDELDRQYRLNKVKIRNNCSQ
jgi:hypothetical protein